MKRKALALGAAVIAIAAPAAAHHSHAMFDDSQEVTIAGRVSAVRFANPHVYLMVEVVDASGATAQWAVEMSHIRNMLTRGVRADTFQVGQDVEITMNPLRNGDTGGNYTHIGSIGGIRNTADDNSWKPAPL